MELELGGFPLPKNYLHVCGGTKGAHNSSTSLLFISMKLGGDRDHNLWKTIQPFQLLIPFD